MKTIIQGLVLSVIFFNTGHGSQTDYTLPPSAELEEIYNYKKGSLEEITFYKSPGGELVVENGVFIRLNEDGTLHIITDESEIDSKFKMDSFDKTKFTKQDNSFSLISKDSSDVESITVIRAQDEKYQYLWDGIKWMRVQSFMIFPPHSFDFPEIVETETKDGFTVSNYALLQLASPFPMKIVSHGTGDLIHKPRISFLGNPPITVMVSHVIVHKVNKELLLSAAFFDQDKVLTALNAEYLKPGNYKTKGLRFYGSSDDGLFIPQFGRYDSLENIAYWAILSATLAHSPRWTILPSEIPFKYIFTRNDIPTKV